MSRTSENSEVSVANNQLNAAAILGSYTGEGILKTIKPAENIKGENN